MARLLHRKWRVLAGCYAALLIVVSIAWAVYVRSEIAQMIRVPAQVVSGGSYYRRSYVFLYKYTDNAGRVYEVRSTEGGWLATTLFGPHPDKPAAIYYEKDRPTSFLPAQGFSWIQLWLAPLIFGLFPVFIIGLVVTVLRIRTYSR